MHVEAVPGVPEHRGEAARVGEGLGLGDLGVGLVEVVGRDVEGPAQVVEERREVH